MIVLLVFFVVPLSLALFWLCASLNFLKIGSVINGVVKLIMTALSVRYGIVLIIIASIYVKKISSRSC